MRGQEEKLIVWGFKSDPLTFLVLSPFFFSFSFGGNIFCKQTFSDNGTSLKEVQVAGGVRFPLEFSSQLFLFFHIFLSHVGLLFEGSPRPLCTSCQSATLPMNIKTFLSHY